MLRICNISSLFILTGVLALSLIATISGAQAQGKYEVLYAFCPQRACLDGAAPVGGVVEDKKGNLYGTTWGGGWGGAGAVYKLAPGGVESVLYDFYGYPDGDGPRAGLTMDKEGNFYGTTNEGGTGGPCNGRGCGTVFELAADDAETTLYAFKGPPADGAFPVAGLIADSNGNLYGTTPEGGNGCQGQNSQGCGIVFRIAPDGTETVLYNFCPQGYPCADGAYPQGGLIADKKGNLYGTIWEGGAAGHGAIFKLSPDGAETLLYSFTGGTDGAGPSGSLIADKQGNFYGVTEFGGGGTCADGGCGTVFKLAADGAETVLHSFASGADGHQPFTGLVMDDAGNLYGTTPQGGGGGGSTNRDVGCGVVFKLAPNGTETILHAFKGAADGCVPYAGLIADKRGNLYGTTAQGGRIDCGPGGCGTVFRLKE